jgi:hypothetical protein
VNQARRVPWAIALALIAIPLAPTPTGAAPQRNVEELYDLQADPDEVVNLIDDPASKDVRDDLRARLRKWQQDTKDPWVLKYDYE